MQTVIYVHMAFAVLKICLWGFGAGMADIFSIMFCFCAINRLDFCLILFYMVTLFTSIMQIVISLGFYWQVHANGKADDTSAIQAAIDS